MKMKVNTNRDVLEPFDQSQVSAGRRESRVRKGSRRRSQSVGLGPKLNFLVTQVNKTRTESVCENCYSMFVWHTYIECHIPAQVSAGRRKLDVQTTVYIPSHAGSNSPGRATLRKWRLDGTTRRLRSTRPRRPIDERPLRRLTGDSM